MAYREDYSRNKGSGEGVNASEIRQYTDETLSSHIPSKEMLLRISSLLALLSVDLIAMLTGLSAPGATLSI